MPPSPPLVERVGGVVVLRRATVHEDGRVGVVAVLAPVVRSVEAVAVLLDGVAGHVGGPGTHRGVAVAIGVGGPGAGVDGVALIVQERSSYTPECAVAETTTSMMPVPDTDVCDMVLETDLDAR